MDASSPHGLSRFVMGLNAAFAHEAATRPRLLLQDVNGISARFGIRHWFDWDRYFSYKLLLTPEANLELARSLASLVNAAFGKTRKVLVLDLDNTLWGALSAMTEPTRFKLVARRRLARRTARSRSTV